LLPVVGLVEVTVVVVAMEVPVEVAPVNPAYNILAALDYLELVTMGVRVTTTAMTQVAAEEPVLLVLLRY
jgi:hypothetical protein